MRKLYGRLRANWPVIATALIIGIPIGWYWVATREDRQERAKMAAAEQQNFARRLQDKAARWAAVVKEKELSPGETLRLVEIPDRQFGLINTYCVIYINDNYRTAQLVCPNTEELSTTH